MIDWLINLFGYTCALLIIASMFGGFIKLYDRGRSIVMFFINIPHNTQAFIAEAKKPPRNQTTRFRRARQAETTFTGSSPGCDSRSPSRSFLDSQSAQRSAYAAARARRRPNAATKERDDGLGTSPRLKPRRTFAAPAYLCSPALAGRDDLARSSLRTRCGTDRDAAIPESPTRRNRQALPEYKAA